MIKNLANKIKLVALDVDGVMTDGSITYGDNGTEFKTFNSKDGIGLKLLQQHGIKIAIITSRISTIVERRAQELNITNLFQGVVNKLQILHELSDKFAISLTEMAFLGDDLPDLPAIQAVGLGMTVFNGHDQLKSHADGITKSSGGHGAVREFCDLILQSQKFTT